MWLLGDWEGLILILGAYCLGLLFTRSIIAFMTSGLVKMSLTIVFLRVGLGEGVWLEEDGRLGDEAADEVADEGLDLEGGLGGTWWSVCG